MDCNQARGLAPGFLESTLSASDGVAVEAHLNACTACQEALSDLMGEPVLRPHVPYFYASLALRERVTRSLDQTLSKTAPPATQPLLRWTMPEWLKLGMVSAATAVLMTALLLPLRVDLTADATADTLVASHIRSNRLDKPIDVATSDRHTVKPWLSQKLGFSPAVPDLAAAGFKLLGGRIEYVDDRFVAAIVYQRRQHVIDVYVWPGAKSGAGLRPISRNGFHVVRWTLDDMTYCAVSDLNVDELKQFADFYARGT